MKIVPYPSFLLENEFLCRGEILAGIDEVGRGCIAGPVLAVCYSPKSKQSCINEVNDSKKLSEKKRILLFKKLIANGYWAFGTASPSEIDMLGIIEATYLAMMRAYYQMYPKPDYLIIDGEKTVRKFPISNCYYFAKGDTKYYSIAAASIIAKVLRDRLISKYSSIYPQYDLDKNKGYGSKAHITAIKEHGLTPLHRRSFIHF